MLMGATVEMEEKNKYRSMDEEDATKSAKSYKAIAGMFAFFFVITCVIIGVLGNRVASLNNAYRSLSAQSSINSSLWVLPFTGESATSMLMGNTAMVEVRQNASVAGLAAVQIFFNTGGEFTSVQYGMNGTATNSYNGKWSIATSTDPTLVDGIQVSFGAGGSAEIGILDDIWNFYVIDKTNYAIVSMTTGMFLGVIYKSSIVSGDQTNGGSLTKTYTSLRYHQVTMLTLEQVTEFLSGQTITTRFVTSSSVSVPLVQSFYNSSGNMTRVSMSNDGTIQATNMGTWGVFIDSYNRTLQWEQFSDLFDGVNKTGIWYMGATGMFPTTGPTVLSSGSLNESVGIPVFKGHAYFNEVLGGNQVV